jgi:hypothetical protein
MPDRHHVRPNRRKNPGWPIVSNTTEHVAIMRQSPTPDDLIEQLAVITENVMKGPLTAETMREIRENIRFIANYERLGKMDLLL